MAVILTNTLPGTNPDKSPGILENTPHIVGHHPILQGIRIDNWLLAEKHPGGNNY